MPLVMVLFLLFALGITNFALSKAVLESRHPILDTLPPQLRRGGVRISLGWEFLVLVAAMLLLDAGWSAAAWAYAGYTLLNASFGWLVLGRHI